MHLRTLAVCLLASCPAYGNALEDWHAASGGTAWNAVRTLKMDMTIAAGGVTARAQRIEDVETCRYVEHDDWPAFTAFDGFDGVTHWVQQRSRIAYAQGDTEAALEAANGAFLACRGYWFADRHPATIAATGTHEDRGHIYDVLVITPEGGRRFEAWIDRATHLLSRTIEQQAEERAVTTYRDYRRVNGVMLPFTIESGDGSDPDNDQVSHVTALAVNAQVPEDAYDLPPRPAGDIAMPGNAKRVDVPFQIDGHGKILVPIVVAGHTLDAEFDSGGSLLLQPQSIAALGLGSSGRDKQSGGGQGTTTSSTGRLRELGIGGVTIKQLVFHSYAFRPAAPQLALIGLELLQRFVVRLDFTTKIMTLIEPDAFIYQGAGAVIPFHFQDNQPEVKGAVDGIAGLFTIDTGDSGGLLLLAPFASRHDLARRYHATIAYSGHAVGATHGVVAETPVGALALYGADGRMVAQARPPDTYISMQTSGWDAHPYIAGNVGMGVLRQFTVIFDYPRQRMILEAPVGHS